MTTEFVRHDLAKNSSTANESDRVRVIREGGVSLVTQISGLLLSAIAVQLVADAVRAFIAGKG